MGWVSEDGVVGFGMEGAADEGGVALDGEEGYVVECRNKVGDASYSKAVLDGVGNSPSCSWYVLFVVAKGDDGWCCASVFEEEEFTKEVSSAGEMMSCAAIWYGRRG